jgi:integrase
VAAWFRAGRRLAGLPDDYATRALRHTFASVALASEVPITDVSKWLGHQNINTTYAIYGHLVPSSWDRAKKALDSEYATWKVGPKTKAL